jgi:hypothetical protein
LLNALRMDALQFSVSFVRGVDRALLHELRAMRFGLDLREFGVSLLGRAL